MAYKISVIGGINLDIGGRPSESLRLRDSNIGTISRSAGGVGFNIAKNLAEKGTTVSRGRHRYYGHSGNRQPADIAISVCD